MKNEEKQHLCLLLLTNSSKARVLHKVPVMTFDFACDIYWKKSIAFSSLYEVFSFALYRKSHIKTIKIAHILCLTVTLRHSILCDLISATEFEIVFTLVASKGVLERGDFSLFFRDNNRLWVGIKTFVSMSPFTNCKKVNVYTVSILSNTAYALYCRLLRNIWMYIISLLCQYHEVERCCFWPSNIS